jgi:hypothetical protein
MKEEGRMKNEESGAAHGIRQSGWFCFIIHHSSCIIP